MSSTFVKCSNGHVSEVIQTDWFEYRTCPHCPERAYNQSPNPRIARLDDEYEHDFKCLGGHVFTSMVKEREWHNDDGSPTEAIRRCPECDHYAEKLYPGERAGYYVQGEIKAFQSTSGKYFDSRKKWRQHLKDTGSFEYGHSDMKYMQERHDKKHQNKGKDPNRKKEIVEALKRKDLI